MPTQYSHRVTNYARALNLEGYSPSEALIELEDRYGEEKIPSLRTLQNWWRAWRSADDEKWTLHSSAVDAEDVGSVLDVLASMVAVTAGRVRSLTNGQARRVAQIKRARPGLWGWRAYQLACMYEEREGAQEAVDDLDLYLAMEPWRSERPEGPDDAVCALDYMLAIADGAPAVPDFIASPELINEDAAAMLAATLRDRLMSNQREQLPTGAEARHDAMMQTVWDYLMKRMPNASDNYLTEFVEFIDEVRERLPAIVATALKNTEASDG